MSNKNNNLELPSPPRPILGGDLTSIMSWGVEKKKIKIKNKFKGDKVNPFPHFILGGLTS